MNIYKSSTSYKPTIYTFTTGILEGVHPQDKRTTVFFKLRLVLFSFSF